MPDFAEGLGASKAASTLLVLFIPSKDRDDQPIDQAFWVTETLNALGSLFGGATAFPQGKGVWRDDGQGGKLLLTSRSSSSATPARRFWSRNCRNFVISFIEWVARLDKERLAW